MTDGQEVSRSPGPIAEPLDPYETVRRDGHVVQPHGNVARVVVDGADEDAGPGLAGDQSLQLAPAAAVGTASAVQSPLLRNQVDADCLVAAGRQRNEVASVEIHIGSRQREAGHEAAVAGDGQGACSSPRGNQP